MNEPSPGDPALPPCVVADANAIMSLSVLRPLGRRGIPVHGLFRAGSEGGYGDLVRASRYLSQAHSAHGTLTEGLLDLARRLPQKPVLIPVGDSEMLEISRERERLAPHYHLALPGHEQIEILLNKDLFYPYCQREGFPIPDTLVPADAAEVRSRGSELRYPCIIKPAWRDQAWANRYGFKKVLRAESPAELIATYQGMGAFAKGCTIQSIVPGGEENIFCSFAFFDRHAKPLSMLVCTKNRQNPPHFGDTAYARTLEEPRVADLTVRLAEAMKLHGYVSVEFKRDPRDGEFKIVEVTPARLDRQAGICGLAGASMPEVWYEYSALGVEAERPPYRSGVAWLSEAHDFSALLKYARLGEFRPLDWLQSYRQVGGLEILTRDDPGPGLALARTLRKRLAQKLLKRSLLPFGRNRRNR